MSPLTQHSIERQPARAAAASLLESAALPSSDLTDAHMEHFFYCGDASHPCGLVGIELRGRAALLRSLVVDERYRSTGMGAQLVERAEAHARASGASAIYLLTTTAEHFFAKRGYAMAARASAPAEIRNTRQFADICPASSAFMVKPL
jgi:amino-acid N-acetyltransferase